jgi:hypothetical protein
MPYSGNSIVDYLASTGGDPSLAARRKLAEQYGIAGYAGTADQNTQLLAQLKGAGTTPLPAATATAIPSAAPGVDPNLARVQAAAKAGVGFSELGSVLPPQNNAAIRDELAKQYGYGDFNAFSQQVFKPSRTTEQLYKDAYKAAGLDGILASIKTKKDQLNAQAATVSENPWLDEASRSGKLRILNDLASGDIGNDVELYKAKLDQVNGLVDRGANDLHEDQVLRAQQFEFLLKQAEEEAVQRQQSALSQYLPDYLAAQPQDAPKTVTIGDNLYAWNGESFEQIGSGSSGFTLGEGQQRYDAEGNLIASNAGGQTNPSAGIVGGYNIGSYATDPKHEANVATIYSKTQGIKTAAQADAYIKSKFPNSPITGGMVVSAANQYGIDPGMLIAMMQQDSSLGTRGLGAKTFNPGNVGNDDSGATRNYGSWSAGVNAVAQWLSKAKVAGNPAFTQAAQNVSAGLTKDQRAAFNQNLAAAMAADPAQAKNLIITTAINALPSADLKNKAFGRITAIDELDRIQNLLTEFQAAGGSTGLLTGTDEQIAQKLGKTTDPKLAEIGNAIAASIVAYRNAVSGAAFTESEAKQYEKMFPSASKSTPLNTALINSLKATFNSQQRSALSTVLGSTDTYDTLQNLPRAGQVVTVEGKGYRVAPDGDTLIPLFSTMK